MRNILTSKYWEKLIGKERLKNIDIQTNAEWVFEMLGWNINAKRTK